MEIIPVFTSEDAEQKMDSGRALALHCYTVKFVTLSETQTVIGNGWNLHTTLIPEGSTRPIGGGKIDRDVRAPDAPPRIQWGSSSIREQRRPDRPQDEAEAARILEEIKTAFIEWRDRAKVLPKP